MSNKLEAAFHGIKPVGVLYLAGPMSGLPDFNYGTFRDEAGRLRAGGFEVLNPAENEMSLEAPDWLDWMRLAVGQLIRADGVALLPGWDTSRGAMVEHNLAVGLGLPVATVPAWLTAKSNYEYMERLTGALK